MVETLPCSKIDSLSVLKNDVAAILEGLGSTEIPSLPFPDIENILPKALKEGAILDIDDLFALGIWAKSYNQLFSSFKTLLRMPARGMTKSKDATLNFTDDPWSFIIEEERWAKPGIELIVEAAPSLQGIARTIFAVLTPEGELRDLPRIRSIRTSLQKVQTENHKLLNRYLTDPSLQDALQSNIATERDNRTVIAIKANFRGRIKGIVHEFSSSGQTVFVEPLELVERNNKLFELEMKLAEEIRKILKETLTDLRPNLPALSSGRVFLALADIRLARAFHAKRGDLVIPATLETGIHLYQARHPLLGKKAVPIDVDIPDDARVLIITGPNTGGKTVSLKTIGLLALLHQYGTGIPALSTSGFAVFDTIFADIGDEQSIDQSLSTFSGHMSVISDIIRNATKHSLVLLDELGAGTDPEEGCAIAMALLDHFLDLGSATIVTTHHGVLKNYGYTKAGCLNASMEFDAKSLSPTYRIIMGVPGESRALEIAHQIGLSNGIIDAARNYLKDERSDYSALIRSLGEKQIELDNLAREKRKQLQGALEARRRADLEKLKVRQQEIELRKKGVSDLAHFLSESRKSFEKLVREARESNLSTTNNSEGRKFLTDVARELEKNQEDLEAMERDAEILQREIQGDDRNFVQIEPHALKQGDKIWYKHHEAIFLRKLDDASHALIQVGALRLSVSLTEIQALSHISMQEQTAELSYQVELSSDGSNVRGAPAAELDVRGLRLFQALEMLRKQIDAASFAGLDVFSVIHGTGEGILARGIHEWLKAQSSVADYYFARAEDGGFGKTWIRLKT